MSKVPEDCFICFRFASNTTWVKSAFKVCTFLRNACIREMPVSPAHDGRLRQDKADTSNSFFMGTLLSIVTARGWRCSQHLTGTIGLQRAYDAAGFHLLDHARGTVIADLQPPLHAGDRGLAALGDDAHRLVVQRIRLAAGLPFLARFTREAGDGLAGAGQDLFYIVGLAPALQVCHHLVHFLVADE